jgi:NAD-dependent deacetylase
MLGPFERIVILTGAGVSAESGLGTFRDKDGLWTKYDLSEVATPEGFAKNPEFVLEFYNARRKNLLESKPNAAHFALGKLEADYPGEVVVVTQNVDTLHEQGGSKNIIHMHGELLRTKCNACGHSHADEGELRLDTVCGACGTSRALRPDVVWFGEIPYYMEEIQDVLARADLFLSIGTSGQVYPAAGFVQFAASVGAHTVELNLEPSDGNHLFAEHHTGPASEMVPQYVNRLLAGV